jgi:hypothetical protein
MSGELYPDPTPRGAAIGPISQGHRANPKRFHDIRENGYRWTKKKLPTPGSGNYAFDTLGLVEFTPIGPSEFVRRELPGLQMPQVYITGQMLTTTGYGGLAAGQIINQPLLDPYSQTVGGV